MIMGKIHTGGILGKTWNTRPNKDRIVRMPVLKSEQAKKDKENEKGRDRLQ